MLIILADYARAAKDPYQTQPMEETNMSMVGQCDKCGIMVSPENDATLIERELLVPGTSDLEYVVVQSRHFLPLIDESGKVICPGSPSRAQYIEGQPRDTRPGATYEADDEPKWREAFNKITMKYTR